MLEAYADTPIQFKFAPRAPVPTKGFKAQLKQAECVPYQCKAILVASETKQRIPVTVTGTAVEVSASLSQVRARG